MNCHVWPLVAQLWLGMTVWHGSHASTKWPVENASRRTGSSRCKIKLDLRQIFEVNLVFRSAGGKPVHKETWFPRFRGAASHYHDSTRSRAPSCVGFIAPSAESPDWKRTTGSLHGQKSVDGDSVSRPWNQTQRCLQQTGYRRFAASDACIEPFKDILSPFRSSDGCAAAQTSNSNVEHSPISFNLQSASDLCTKWQSAMTAFSRHHCCRSLAHRHTQAGHILVVRWWGSRQLCWIQAKCPSNMKQPTEISSFIGRCSYTIQKKRHSSSGFGAGSN